MLIQIIPREIAGLILCVFVFVLSGCGQITQETELRNLSDEVKAKISIGDTRQKVRSVLGNPLVDAQSLGVEVYRLSSRDLIIVLAVYPIPFPGEKVTGAVIVVYDENDKVKEIDADIVDKYFSFGVTAGGFSFVNIYGRKPETLLGPPISWEKMTEGKVPERSCALVLLMGECPMEKISLDNKRIIDYSPAGADCDVVESNYFGTFIQRYIAPGKHRLEVKQRTKVINRDFSSAFECDNGERIYVELEATTFRQPWWIKQLKGELSISRIPPKKRKFWGDRTITNFVASR